MEEGEAEEYICIRSDHAWRESFMYKCIISFLIALQVSNSLQPRWGHSITAFGLVDGETEVTVFGGTADRQTVSDRKQSKLAGTTLLQFCKCMSMFTHIVCANLLLQHNHVSFLQLPF